MGIVVISWLETRFRLGPTEIAMKWILNPIQSKLTKRHQKLTNGDRHLVDIAFEQQKQKKILFCEKDLPALQ